MNCAMPCARWPLRVIGPDRIGLEAALLPDHAGKKLDRQVLRFRRRFNHQAHRLAGAGVAGILVLGVGDRKFFDARMDHPYVGGSRRVLRDRRSARPASAAAAARAPFADRISVRNAMSIIPVHLGPV